MQPPANAWERSLRRLKDGGEALIARGSVHDDLPVYPLEWFPWTDELSAGWRTIRSELDAIMPQRALMPSFHEVLEPVATITGDDDWKTFFLVGPGMDCRENRERCPETMRLLASIPGLQTAMFSILSPGKHIPAHRGAYNGVLRYHLGLIVPEPAERCRIRIADEVHHWAEGEGIVFDDTFNHEVWNETEGHRVVLFVDFLRPLRAPYRWLNERIVSAAAKMPTLKRANATVTDYARRMND